MEVKRHSPNMVELVSSEIINDSQEMLDFMMNNSAKVYIIQIEHLPNDILQLSNGKLGDILQKISNYQKKLGILGDFENIKSKAMRDFIYESNKTGQIVFKNSLNELMAIFGST